MISALLSNNEKLDNTVVAALQLVKALNIEIAPSEIKRKLLWSPSYPSINSIESFLKQRNTDTVVMAVNKDNLDKLPPVFLCHLQDEEEPFKIVINHDATAVYWLGNNNKNVAVPISQFLEQWSGIVLIAEKQESSGTPDYKNTRRMEWWEQYAIPLTMLVFLIAAIINVLVTPDAGAAVSIIAVLLQLLNITGIIICIALLKFLIDDTDDGVKKLCGTGKNPTDCTKIIAATDAKLFGFSWAEIGLIWFFGAALSMATTVPNMVAGFFCIAALIFIPYSVYYQLRIARQWCNICLYILCIITIQAGLYGYLFAWHFTSISLHNFFYYLPAALCCIIIPAICWLAIRRFTYNRKALLLAEQDYFRLKHNPKVYDLLQTNDITVDTKDAPVSFNNTGNNHFEITIVSSLSCAPCGEAHTLLGKIIRNNPLICFNMYILPVMDPAYNTIVHLKILLTILEEEGDEAFLDALHYWYHVAGRDCMKFLQRFPERHFSASIDDKIAAMEQWIYQYEIKTTPAYFINGKEMPATYGIEDILAMVSNF